MDRSEQTILPALPFTMGDPTVSKRIVVVSQEPAGESVWEQVPNLGMKCVLLFASHLIWLVALMLIVIGCWGTYQMGQTDSRTIAEPALRY